MELNVLEQQNSLLEFPLAIMLYHMETARMILNLPRDVSMSLRLYKRLLMYHS